MLELRSKLPLLPNGKLNRRALPDPYEKTVRGEYVAPRNDLEEKLCKAFEKVLHIEQVGITENFYELGGSSLSAMEVLVEMDLDDLSSVDIFQGGTPEKIAALYQDKIAGKENITEEEKEARARLVPHPLPPVQVSVIDFQLFSPKAPMWIFPFLFTFEKNAGRERVYSAAKKVLEWHPIFSTVFEFNEDCALQQRFAPEKRAPLTVERMSDSDFAELLKQPFEPFKLLGEPMVRLRMFETESKIYLMFVYHHIVMDGSSIQIIFGNLARAYAGEELVLDTYYSYLEDEERSVNTEAYAQARKYYQENYDETDWCLNIEPDKAEKGNTNATCPIPTSLTPEKLAQMEKDCNISRNGFMTTVSVLALAKVNRKSDILVTFIYDNRADQRKKNAGGLLARTIPVGIKLGRYETLRDLYEGIRRQTADGIANSIYDWGTIHENAYQTDAFPVVYETASITGFGFLKKLGAAMMPLDAKNEAALHRTMLQVFEKPDSISVLLSYMKNIYTEEKIQAFAKEYQALCDRLIAIRNPEAVRVQEVLA